MIKNLEYKLIKGQKPTIVMLHGWGMTKECFDIIIENINPKYQKLTLDFFGFGNSSEPYDYYDTYEYAYSIYILLCKLNINDIVLVGHSFGGRVAIILSSIFNIKIHNLILTSSAGINKFSLLKWLKVRIYKLKRWLNNHIKHVNFNLFNSGSEDYKSLNMLMKKVFVRVVNQDLKYLAKNININTLLVWDKKDNITPFYICKKLKTLINKSNIVLYKHGKHFVFIKNYNKFSSIINNVIINDNDIN